MPAVGLGPTEPQLPLRPTMDAVLASCLEMDDTERRHWLRLGGFLAAVVGLTVLAAWLVDHDQLVLAVIVYAPALWLGWPRRR